MPLMELNVQYCNYRRSIIQRSHEPHVPPLLSIKNLCKSAEIVHI